MARIPLFAVLALPLAACGSGGPTVTATNASMAEVATKVAAANAGGDMIGPGRWEGTLKIDHMKMPDMKGLPPEMRRQMEARMAGSQSFVSCVTEEEIKARQGFFRGDNVRNNCRYDHYTMAGGKLDAAMNCTMPTGTMTMTMTGSYAPDSYHIETESKSSGAAGAGSNAMTIDARRVGACRGTADEDAMVRRP
jgi:hypothetical protein